MKILKIIIILMIYCAVNVHFAHAQDVSKKWNKSTVKLKKLRTRDLEQYFFVTLEAKEALKNYTDTASSGTVSLVLISKEDLGLDKSNFSLALLYERAKKAGLRPCPNSIIYSTKKMAGVLDSSIIYIAGEGDDIFFLVQYKKEGNTIDVTQYDEENRAFIFLRHPRELKKNDVKIKWLFCTS